MKHNILKRGILPAIAIMYAATEAGASPAATEETRKPFVIPSVPKKKDRVTIETKKIITDHGTQPRVAIDMEVVEEYRELIKTAKADGKDYPLPPIQGVRTPQGKIILTDGFQRLEANKGVHSDIDIEVVEGDEQLAVVMSLSANAQHGLRRTSKDKRNAIKRAFEIEGVELLTDGVIADMCAVSTSLVKLHRPATKSPSVRVGKGGKKINTANLGKNRGKGKAKKKAPKKKKDAAAKKGGENNTGAREARTMELIQKIAKNVGGVEGMNISDAINNGSLPLTPRDLQDWAGLTPESAKKIAPLVVSNRMKPWKAFEFSKEAPSERTVTELHNHALASGGEYVYEDEKLGIKIVVTASTKKK